jgi:hypothetical protein
MDLDFPQFTLISTAQQSPQKKPLVISECRYREDLVFREEKRWQFGRF